MRMIGLMLVTLGIFALHPASAGAALYGGTWVPVASATAEYCLDGICAEHPADASIELAPPPSPEVLGQSRLTIGFGPLGFESFDVILGSTVGEAALAAGVLTIRGAIPGFDEYDLSIRILSDRSITLDGFLHIEPSVGVFDVRFRNVEFVPVPEPSSACLIGLGLAALARRRRGSSVPAGPSELN